MAPRENPSAVESSARLVEKNVNAPVSSVSVRESSAVSHVRLYLLRISSAGKESATKPFGVVVPEDTAKAVICVICPALITKVAGDMATDGYFLVVIT